MSTDCYRRLGPGGRNLVPTGDVGINTLPDQIVSKQRKAGFNFNVLVVGETAMGKSTLMETLFKIKMPESDPKDRKEGLEITETTIEEDDVSMDLKIVCTQNFSRSIDKTGCIDEAMTYIEATFEEFLDTEWTVPRRKQSDPDPRIHVCLYMLNPTGRSVRSVDMVCMKQLAARCNLIPVIAKADTISRDVIEGFKDRITDDLCEYGVLYYEFPMEDPSMIEKNEHFQNELPFAVSSSSDFVIVGGKKVRGRQYPWGVVEIENDAHTQFNMLRDSVIRSNMEHLIGSTHSLHYEEYRRRRLMEVGYCDNPMHEEAVPLAFNAKKQLDSLEEQMSGRSKESTDTLMRKVNEKILEVKGRDEAIDAEYTPKLRQATGMLEELRAQKVELEAELKEIVASVDGRKKKKKSGVFNNQRINVKDRD